MDQGPSAIPNGAFDLNELARLNDEVRQLRESVRRKKLDYEKAKAEGKKIPLDLRPELLLLDRFVERLDQLREKLRSSALAKTDREASDAEALRNLLLEMKDQLVNEKERLEGENAAGELQEQLKSGADELRVLREQLAEERRILREERVSLESLVAQVKDEHERMRSTSAKPPQEVRGNEGIRPKTPDDYGRVEQPEDRKLEFLIDQLSVIKTELREVREHLAKEERAPESTQRELNEDRRRIREERKALERRIAEAQKDLTERTVQRIRAELQSQRIELANLRKSIEQIKAANRREHRTIERDRNTVMRVQMKLEREKQRIARKAALLELGATREMKFSKTGQAAKSRRIKRRRDAGARGHGARKGSVIKENHQGRVIQGGVILGVRLGTEDYGIDTTRVREIVRMREITPIPRQPRYVEGVMNVRGAIVPVVNLKKRFGLQENGSKHPHIVIVESLKGPVGLMVDSVSEVIRVPVGQIHPAPQVAKGIDGEYLRGICELGEKLMIYLDLEKLLEQAVPIGRTTGPHPLSSRESGLTELSKDERRVVNAIPRTGRTKTSLGRRVGLSPDKLDKLISSLKVRGLIQVARAGNSRLIRRTGS